MWTSVKTRIWGPHLKTRVPGCGESRTPGSATCPRSKELHVAIGHHLHHSQEDRSHRLLQAFQGVTETLGDPNSAGHSLHGTEGEIRGIAQMPESGHLCPGQLVCLENSSPFVGVQPTILGKLTRCTEVFTIKVKYKGLRLSKATAISRQLGQGPTWHYSPATH